MTRPGDPPPLPLDPTLPQSAPEGAPAARFLPGRLVAARYRIVRFIAEGGMGEVYEAEDEHLHERVALKAMRARAAADAQVIARFKREIQLSRKVTHPNVCRIFDLGVDRDDGADVLFLTMELVRGPTLAERLQSCRVLPLAEAAEILAQVAAALDAAHAAGVIHRDLKTTNILLAEVAGGRPRAVVTDFGLARSLDDAAMLHDRVTGAVQLVGTPAYMAPEQVEGHELTARTDVYQFGVVMYEICTGQLPFEGHSPLSTAVMRIKSRPRAPRELRAELSSAWEAAILRCLEPEPSLRFARASDALHAAYQQPRRRSRGLGVMLAVIAAVLTAVAVVAAARLLAPHKRITMPTLPAPPSGARRSLAVLPLANLGDDPELAWVSLALAETFATELGASEQLRVASESAVERTRADLELKPAPQYSAETLARLRANLGVDYVLVGSYLPMPGAAGRVRVELRLQATANGTTALSYTTTGNSRDLPALVAAAAPRLYARLGVAPLDAQTSAAVRAAQPASSEAARAYSEGTTHLHRLDCRTAAAWLERAVAADARHALAQAALAEAYLCLGDEARALASARRAWELSARLRREERLRIEAELRTMEHDHARVITIYRTLWEYFPDNLSYGLELGRAQAAAGQLHEAEATISALRQAGGDGDPELDLLCAGVEYELGSYEQDLSCARRAAGLSRARGARLLYGQAKRDEAWALRFLGRTDEALAAALESRRVFAAGGNHALELNVLNTMAGVYLDQSRLREALAARLSALGLARRLGDARWSARLASNSAELARSFGVPLAARALAQEGLQLALRIEERSIAAYAYVFVGNSLLDAGRPAEARPYFERGLELTTEIGRKQAMVSANVGLAWALSCAADFAGAHAALDRAFALHDEMKTPPVEAAFELAHVLAREGKRAEAEKQLDQALAMVTRQRDLFEADGRALRADLLAARGDLAGARREAALAVLAATRIGVPGFTLPARISAAGAARDAARLTALADEAERSGYQAMALDARIRAARLTGAARDTLAKQARALGHEALARAALRE
jgi:eukaryotic-like serine/threonine-protein kinase